MKFHFHDNTFAVVSNNAGYFQGTPKPDTGNSPNRR